MNCDNAWVCSDGLSANRTRFSVGNTLPAAANTWSWANGKLHLRMDGSQDPNQLEIVAPALSALMIVQSAQNVTLRGLRFQHSGDGGVATNRHLIKLVAAMQVLSSTGVNINGCEVAGSDGAGIFVNGGSRVSLQSLYIHDIAGIGVHLQDVNQSTLDDTVVVGAAVTLSRGMNLTVARVDLSQTSNSGLSIFGLPTDSASPKAAKSPLYTVQDSHFHAIGQGLVSDFGAVYLAPADLSCWQSNRSCSMPSLIQNNLIHGTRQLEYGANGIYLDDAASGIVVTQNLVYDTGGAAVYAHCGHDNIVEGNVFAMNNLQDHRAPWQGCDESGVGRVASGEAVVRRNVIAAIGDAAIAGASHATAAWIKHVNTTSFHHNLYSLHPHLTPTIMFPPGDITFKQWQAEGQDVHSMMGDAGFVNASTSDFRLVAASVARTQLGIGGPQYAAIGPRKTEALLRLQPPATVFDRYPFVHD